MEFVSVSYLIFLPICIILYYLVPRRQRIALIAVVSVGFYVAFEPRLFFVMPFFIFFGYLGGRLVYKTKNTFYLFSLISLCVAVLCYYKYRGIIFNNSTLLMPVGISYYTFSTIGYLTDVFTKTVKPEKNIFKYALFIGFFAQLFAGPIARTDTVLPQLSTPADFNYSKTVTGLFLLVIGFFKKLAVAVPIGIITAPIFADINTVGGTTVFVATLLYTLQLYFDFLGYTDIARGSALLLGITLAENFKQPFHSTNFSAFWGRWHISLSRWLQDYIFTPLVWKKPLSRLPLVGRFFTETPVLSSIFILFVISGLWHGVGLTFLIWGTLQAVFRIGEELLHRYYKKPPKHQKTTIIVAKRIVVFLLFSTSLIFFKAENLGQAIAVFDRIRTAPNIDLVGQFFEATLAGFNATPFLAIFYIVFCTTALIFALGFDNICNKTNKTQTELIFSLKFFPRWLFYFILCGFVFVAFILQNGGFGVSASFIYPGF